MKEELEDVQRQFSQFNNVINEMTCRLISSAYFKSENNNTKYEEEGLTTDDFLRTSQETLTAVRDNWVWLRDLTTCLDKQIENASNYHLFNQSLCEYKKLLKILKLQTQKDFAQHEYTGEHQEANLIYKNIQKMLSTFLQWWERIDAVIFQSRKILPIGLRRVPVDIKRPAKTLISYKSNKFSLKENEDVFVCSSIDPCRWEVENLRGVKDTVPSICVQLSGVETESIEKAVSLRIDLLDTWTVSLKEMGKDLINFMLALFQQSDKALQISMNSYQMESKLEMLELLQVFENLLDKYWSKKAEFHEMRERIYNVHVALSIHNDDEIVDDNTQIDLNTVFLQMAPLVLATDSKQEDDEEAAPKFLLQKSSLTLFIQKYQEFTKYWEVYKAFVEASNDPNHFWMMEEFHKIKHVNIYDLFKFITKQKKEVWTKYLKAFLDQAANSKSASASHLNAESNQWTTTAHVPAHQNRGTKADIHPHSTSYSSLRSNESRLQPLNETDEEVEIHPKNQHQINEHFTTLLDINREPWYHTSYRLMVNENVNLAPSTFVVRNGEISQFFHYLPNADDFEYVVIEDDDMSDSSHVSQSLDEMKYFTQSFTESKEKEKGYEIDDESDLSRILYYSPNAVYNDIAQDEVKMSHLSIELQSKDSNNKVLHIDEIKNASSISNAAPHLDVHEFLKDATSDEEEILQMLQLLSKNTDVKISTDNIAKDNEVTTTSLNPSFEMGDKEMVVVEEQSSKISPILKQAHTLDTTEFSTSVSDVKRSTILINGIYDTLSNELYSLQDAVDNGIINVDNGSFLDTLSEKTISIPMAMNENLIIVESIDDESKKNLHDCGILTIKNIPINKNYDVTLNINEHSNVNEAVNEKVSSTESSNNATEDSVTYLISSVVNLELNTTLSFKEALDQRILDLENGVLVNSENGKNIDIVEAIKCGFLKAELISDTNSLSRRYSQHFTIYQKPKLNSSLSFVPNN